MLATPEDFQRHFELLSDEALLETNREDLVEMARAVYDEELERRGIASASDDEEIASETPEGAAGETLSDPGELVLVATFGVAEEANMARGLLQSAEIPSQIRNELAAVGGFEASLFVPASFHEHAVEILGSQISDEELAAQAEAAAPSEEEWAESEDAEAAEEEHQLHNGEHKGE